MFTLIIFLICIGFVSIIIMKYYTSIIISKAIVCTCILKKSSLMP